MSASPGFAFWRPRRNYCSLWFWFVVALTVLWSDQKMVQANGSVGRLRMRLRSARRKNWPDVVDRDVEQRSRNDARYHQCRAARQILMPRVPPRFHCACPAGKCPLAVLQSDAPLPADLTILFSPRSIKAVAINIGSNHGRIRLSRWRLKFLSRNRASYRR